MGNERTDEDIIASVLAQCSGRQRDRDNDARFRVYRILCGSTFFGFSTSWLGAAYLKYNALKSKHRIFFALVKSNG